MPKPTLGFTPGKLHRYLGKFRGKPFLEEGHNLQLIGEPPPEDAARQPILPTPSGPTVPYGGDVVRPPVAIDASPAAVPPPTPGSLPPREARRGVRQARRSGRQAIRSARRAGRLAIREAAAGGNVQATIDAMSARKASVAGARAGARDALMAAQLERTLSRGRARQARVLPRQTLRQARRTARRTVPFVMP